MRESLRCEQAMFNYNFSPFNPKKIHFIAMLTTKVFSYSTVTTTKYWEELTRSG